MYKILGRYNNSHEAAANALYSVSDDDFLTINYFLVLHEIRDLPKKKHCPKMDFLVSLQPAQSASENPCN